MRPNYTVSIEHFDRSFIQVQQVANQIVCLVLMEAVREQDKGFGWTRAGAEADSISWRYKEEVA